VEGKPMVISRVSPNLFEINDSVVLRKHRKSKEEQ
jgi:hypothetical protein